MHKCQQTFSTQECGEPEMELSLDDNEITGSVRIVRVCSDCGDETKEYTFDISEQFEIPEEHEDHDLELDNESVDSDEHVQTTDRRGKRISNPRYMKTLYGFAASVDVRCGDCDELIANVQFADHIEASGMDEL